MGVRIGMTQVKVSGDGRRRCIDRINLALGFRREPIDPGYFPIGLQPRLYFLRVKAFRKRHNHLR
jgi:hypothetical protein